MPPWCSPGAVRDLRLQRHLRHRVRHQGCRPGRTCATTSPTRARSSASSASSAAGSTRPAARVRGLLLNEDRPPITTRPSVPASLRDLSFGFRRPCRPEGAISTTIAARARGRRPTSHLLPASCRSASSRPCSNSEAGQLPPSSIKTSVDVRARGSNKASRQGRFGLSDPKILQATAVLFRKRDYEALQSMTPEISPRAAD